MQIARRFGALLLAAPLLFINPVSASASAYSDPIQFQKAIDQKVSAEEAAQLSRFYKAVAQRDAEEAKRERDEQVKQDAAAANRGKPRTSLSEKPTPTGDIWWSLAGCETGGKYDNPNTGNGYYGYFQFSKSTWESVGGTGLPSNYSYEEQLALAKKLQAKSGWGQWPRCSRKLGLR